MRSSLQRSRMTRAQSHPVKVIPRMRARLKDGVPPHSEGVEHNRHGRRTFSSNASVRTWRASGSSTRKTSPWEQATSPCPAPSTAEILLLRHPHHPGTAWPQRPAPPLSTPTCSTAASAASTVPSAADRGPPRGAPLIYLFDSPPTSIPTALVLPPMMTLFARGLKSRDPVARSSSPEPNNIAKIANSFWRRIVVGRKLIQHVQVRS
jgi:hypothetical protein